MFSYKPCRKLFSSFNLVIVYGVIPKFYMTHYFFSLDDGATAAQHLTSVTLELGGKSPCIVDSDIHLDRAAKRIAWGKLINTGQTCIAPDYLLVHRQIKTDLVARIKHYIRDFYGEDPAQSPDYRRIIHDQHFERLIAFLDRGEIILGGEYNLDERYLVPTLIDGVTWDDPVMLEEIFGSILPVLTYDEL